MSINVLDVIKLVEESLKNKQKIYFILSVLLPYGVIYWFYPEEFSINTFLFSFILFTFLIHFVYDIYLGEKIKIMMKIQSHLGLDFVKERDKLSRIQEEVLNLRKNLESDRKDFHKLNELNKKLKGWIINSYKRKKEEAKKLNCDMEILENDIYNLKENKNIHEELRSYKELDYFIIFTASSLYILCFFIKTELSSSNIKILFFILFIVLLVIDIMSRNIRYIQLWFGIRLLKGTCLFALIYLKRMNKKYEKRNELTEYQKIKLQKQ